MNKAKIKEILDLHLKWLRSEEGGSRANLRDADLRDANLSDANLSRANLSRANLSRAYLSGADLRDANLSDANLSDANLRGAYLSGADLRDANLRGAYLSRANLSRANLSGAVKVPMYCKWTHGITDGMVHIGCEKRSIEEWDEFFAGDKIIHTARNTEEFKQIQAVYNAYKAYLLTFKSE